MWPWRLACRCCGSRGRSPRGHQPCHRFAGKTSRQHFPSPCPAKRRPPHHVTAGVVQNNDTGESGAIALNIGPTLRFCVGDGPGVPASVSPSRGEIADEADEAVDVATLAVPTRRAVVLSSTALAGAGQHRGRRRFQPWLCDGAHPASPPSARRPGRRSPPSSCSSRKVCKARRGGPPESASSWLPTLGARRCPPAWVSRKQGRQVRKGGAPRT